MIVAEYVWAYVSAGRQRRMRRVDAENDGLEICTRPGRGIGTTGVKRLHLSTEEKRRLFHATGVHVEDENDLSRVYRQTGMRDAEKGEHSYAMWDALKEAGETGKPVDPRYGLASLDLFGDEAKRKPFDFHDRLAYHQARLGG